MLDYIRSLLPSNLNTKPGSALYYLLLLPMVTVYNAIKALIDAIDTSPKAENFGVTPTSTTVATGRVRINTSLSEITTNTVFYNANGEFITVTAAGYPVNDIVEVPVESTTNEYIVGDQFSSSLETIYAIEVVSPIIGLVKAETTEEYWTRIRQLMATNTMSRQGILNIIKAKFPTIIDLVYTDRILIKMPLEKKTVTLTSQTTINDILIKITQADNPITVTKSGELTPEETNIVSANIYPTTISYLSPSYFTDIATFIRTNTDFPIGFTPKIAHAKCYFVTPSTGTLPTTISVFNLWEYKRTLSVDTQVYLNNIPIYDSTNTLGAYYV